MKYRLVFYECFTSLYWFISLFLQKGSVAGAAEGEAGAGGGVGLGGPQGIGVFTRMLHLNEVRCGPALFIYLCCHETRLPSSSEEVANAVAALGVSKR